MEDISMAVSESDLQIQVAEYLTLQYPDVLFHSDFGSGVRLTLGQAVRQKGQSIHSSRIRNRFAMEVPNPCAG